MSIRQKRLESLFKEELSNIISKKIKYDFDIFSIISVDVKGDLSEAYVNVSFIGISDEKEKSQVEIMNNMSRDIRYHLLKRLRLKKIPALHFVIDHSIRDSMKIISIMDKLKDERERTDAE